MSSFLAFPIERIPFVLLVLMISFSIHEFAHAYTATKFGDPTPRSMGRVTLNPRSHLDVFGTILFVIFGIGWAKPVLINPSKFKRRRLMSIIVSVAGPVSNLILSFVTLAVLFMMVKWGWISGWSTGAQEAMLVFIGYMVKLNLFLFIFNLIPIPPLDGYRILSDALPLRISMKLRPYEQWMFFIILLAVFIPPLYNVTLGPIFSLQWDILDVFYSVLEPMFNIQIPKALFGL
ncbi:site-2 protease family protein [Paenibacillus sp. N1-5-1-14]|uniref:site-2 protease family protein n=1 Tax=Paenibacillus radicibacter TaxID=2972488 RepID=UPI002158AA16|nr:site-2 protease family protein [Paenibacillus radicibacter]MCR8645698.1 site-2 protease family protein [Paenibacillus radicibacter]